MKKMVFFTAMCLMTMLFAFQAFATSFDISPSRPDIPVLEELPDPNDPDSPEMVNIPDGDVPLTYIKVRQPDNTYVYILEVDIPLSRHASPQTGDNSRMFAGVMAVAAGFGALLMMEKGKKKKA